MMEWSSGTVPGWQVGPKSSLRGSAGGLGEARGSLGPGCPVRRAADLPLGQVVATAGRKVRFPAGGCRG